MIDHETEIAIVIVAIEPQAALVEHTLLGTVVVGKVLESTSLMGLMEDTTLTREKTKSI